jgi:hypothetical protein
MLLCLACAGSGTSKAATLTLSIGWPARAAYAHSYLVLSYNML